MEGVQDPSNKGKGKAPQNDAMEESDDSSDESGAEDQVCCQSLPCFCENCN
jgi:hypothetical protein